MALSVGLSIELPFERSHNQRVDPGLTFRCLFARKTMFVTHASTAPPAAETPADEG